MALVILNFVKMKFRMTNIYMEILHHPSREYHVPIYLSYALDLQVVKEKRWLAAQPADALAKCIIFLFLFSGMKHLLTKRASIYPQFSPRDATF